MDSDVFMMGLAESLEPAAVPGPGPGPGPVVVNSTLSLLPISVVELAGSWTRGKKK